MHLNTVFGIHRRNCGSKCWDIAGEDCVYITVSDDGAGMSSSKLHIIRETLKGREQTNSIGLQNVNRRLKLVFGEAYGLSVESKQEKGQAY